MLDEIFRKIDFFYHITRRNIGNKESLYEKLQFRADMEGQ